MEITLKVTIILDVTRRKVKADRQMRWARADGSSNTTAGGIHCGGIKHPPPPR